MTDQTKRIEIPNEAMADALNKYLGRFAPVFEAVAFNSMDKLTDDYSGGQWAMYELANGGFYMAPNQEGPYKCSVASNFYSGEMSPDAAGIVASLYALNLLAWKIETDEVINLFHLLREYAVDHDEATEIMAAID